MEHPVYRLQFLFKKKNIPYAFKFQESKKSNLGIANVKVKQNLRSVSDGWVFAQC